MQYSALDNYYGTSYYAKIKVLIVLTFKFIKGNDFNAKKKKRLC